MLAKVDGESSSHRISASPPLIGNPPHAGCNCGRRRTALQSLPLLTGDLVIAARDRAREPELPAATEERARTTSVTSRLARYDLLILAGSGPILERETRIAAEFARHEHRVFIVGGEPPPEALPDAPSITRITLPASTLDTADDPLGVLRDLRRQFGIEAAVVVAPLDLSPELAIQMRERWGWRIMASADAPESLQHAADIRVAFDTELNNDSGPDLVVLPPALPWPARWAELDRTFRAAWAQASIVVLSHDNLAFTRLCVASILENTEYPNYELLLIDNASTDGSAEEIQRLAREYPNIRSILNEENVGFGPGNNQGLSEATGDILVLLNNDTMAPPGWLTRLARHLDDPAIGLIGPATNRTCNEAQLDIPYQTYDEFRAVARTQAERHEGERHPIRMPMMFCTAFRRDTYERLGPLDIRYEVGMFEDEDYALRAKAAGYLTVWTPEVYVHHAYHASIGKLLQSGEYMRLVRLNQGRFEEKWGICWERHRPAPPAPPGPSP